MWGDQIDQIKEIDSLTGEVVKNLKEAMIYPATHYLIPFEEQELAFKEIRADMKKQVAQFKKQKKLKLFILLLLGLNQKVKLVGWINGQVRVLEQIGL